jgi:hypothetical protein
MMQRVHQQPGFRSLSSTGAALELDFAGGARPQLVTSILGACAPEGLDEGAMWSLAVGSRIQCLVAILSLEGEQPVWVERTCRNTDCGESIEVDLAPGELVALAGDVAVETVSVEHAGRTIDVRRPSGEDQLRWQEQAFEDEVRALRQVVGDLVVGDEPPELDDVFVAKVNNALAAVDPLVCLEVAIVCPYCGDEQPYEIDLLELVISSFRERQDVLLAEVHALASRYHWTESEIMAVPAVRRERYLQLVDRGRA